jgi:hypothetical protein
MVNMAEYGLYQPYMNRLEERGNIGLAGSVEFLIRGQKWCVVV